MKYKESVKLDLRTMIMLAILCLTVLFITGCNSNKFSTYHEVTTYCYQQNITESCGIEKCVMLMSAEFSDNIKFSAEKNYYLCKLVEYGEDIDYPIRVE